MEMILKIHSVEPITVNLPKNEKIDFFLENHEIDDIDKIAAEYHTFYGYYRHKENYNFLTKKIIEYYILKQLTFHAKLFSIEGNIRVKIDAR